MSFDCEMAKVLLFESLWGIAVTTATRWCFGCFDCPWGSTILLMEDERDARALTGRIA
jgi:hypothetical protein